MTTLIDDWAETIAGIQTKSNWEWCFRFYSNFQDCPLGNKTMSNNLIVAVVNPSLVEVNRTKIAVPHANYSVSIYSKTSQAFDPADGVVLCEGVDDCWLYTLTRIEANTIAFILITRNEPANIEAAHHKDSRIQNSAQIMSFRGFDDENGAMFLV